MKKVLVVTYYWPPAGGGGVQRIAKFCKYLPEFGWEPVVLTVGSGGNTNMDRSLNNDVQEVSTVVRARSYEPHAIYKRLRSGRSATGGSGTTKNGASSSSAGLSRFAECVRINLFIPDSRIGWLVPAIREGRRMIRELKPDAILSSAPPYTAHLVARALCRHCRAAWVADFRDPWLENHVYNSAPRLGLVRCINRQMEESVLKEADAVLSVGPGLDELLRSKLPISERKRFHVVTNGYDPEDICASTAGSRGNFNLSYFGTLYGFPQAVGEAASIFLNSSGCGVDFRFRVTGDIRSEARRQLAASPVGSFTEQGDYLAHDQMLELLAEPQVLLLVIPDSPRNELIITGKLFEYISSGNPVLGVGPVAGDAAKILEETGAGRMFDYGDSAGIARFLRDCHEAWLCGKLAGGGRRYPAFERQKLTGELANVLNGVCGLPAGSDS